jgi:hypothetical protein
MDESVSYNEYAKKTLVKYVKPIKHSLQKTKRIKISIMNLIRPRKKKMRKRRWKKKGRTI